MAKPYKIAVLKFHGERTDHVEISEAVITDMEEERTGVTKLGTHFKAVTVWIDDGSTHEGCDGKIRLSLFAGLHKFFKVGDKIKIWTSLYTKTVHPDGIFHDLSLGTYFPEKKIMKVKE
jgi:hypothetical protein